jgi:signal transduction histidine kinase/HPt (histidine-containing phosphotransfer) domain-containing protein/ActR/RegA family two-component response regulator
VLAVVPFYYVLTRAPQSIDILTNYIGSANGSKGFDIYHFGIAAGISFSLIAQIGEQVDYLRFMPDKTKENRIGWWAALLAGGPGWVFIACIKQVGGALLAALAVLGGLAIADAKEPVQIYNLAFTYVFANPAVALLVAAFYVILSEFKVNVTNAYAGSLAWSNFFSRVTHSHPGRVVWLVFNSVIALLLMELDLFAALNNVLGLYGNIAVAWIFAIVADLVINKPFGLSPPIVEFKRAHLFDFNPVGVVSVAVASVISTIAFSGLLGRYAQAYSWLIAAVISFMMAPLMAWATGGKYYIARKSWPIHRADTLVKCSVCDTSYAQTDSAHCTFHEAPICSLCCTLETNCKDSCKPATRSLLNIYQGWVGRLLNRVVKAGVSTQNALRVANFSVLWFGIMVVTGLTMWATFPGASKVLTPAVMADLEPYLIRIFIGLAVLASIATWWMVLVAESRNLAEQELRTAKDRAESATRAKGEFLANMSHEIRTPMNAVIGMAYLALKTPLNVKQRDYVDKIHVAATSLLGIINDILDFSKVEAGMLEVENIDFQLDAMLAAVTTVCGYKADEKGLQLLVTSSPSIPQALLGDPLRLGQVLTNLINNAVKFTEHGQVTVSVERLRQDGSEIELQFAVGDSGIGMTPEQIERLFKAFSQADGSTTRKYGGTGLGLSISKQLVELMDGRIWVESMPGQGSVFYFTTIVHLGKAGQAGAVLDDTPVADDALAGITVLLVEDNEVNRQIATELLASVGASVDVAVNGAEAVAHMRQSAPGTYAAVLMDLQMPVMDGFQATRELRLDERFASLPIIAMTAYALNEERERCLEAGMNDHVTKPIEPQVLFRTLIKWCPTAGKGRSSGPRPATTTLHSEAAPVIEGIDTKAGVLRVGGNPATYARMLRMFCDTHAGAALALIAALGNGERDNAERIAHSINGVAANLGAQGLSDTAAVLEHAIAGGRESEAMIDAFAAGLARTIAAIGAPVEVTAPVALAKADAADVIASLTAYLGEHSGETVDYLELHEGTLKAALGQDAFDDLSKAINRFDFAAAQQVLTRG